MIYEKICEGCGKAFQAEHHNTRYCCGTCKRQANKRNVNAANKRFRELEGDRRKAGKGQKKMKTPLAQINEEARKHGMTYGQYVGMKSLSVLKHGQKA